ncbi:hypothetical protein KC343_g8531, partial [Hortaea werneckii]
MNLPSLPDVEASDPAGQAACFAVNFAKTLFPSQATATKINAFTRHIMTTYALDEDTQHLLNGLNLQDLYYYSWSHRSEGDIRRPRLQPTSGGKLAIGTWTAWPACVLLYTNLPWASDNVKRAGFRYLLDGAAGNPFPAATRIALFGELQRDVDIRNLLSDPEAPPPAVAACNPAFGTTVVAHTERQLTPLYHICQEYLNQIETSKAEMTGPEDADQLQRRMIALARTWKNSVYACAALHQPAPANETSIPLTAFGVRLWDGN